MPDAALAAALPPARLWTAAEVAAYLGITPGAFADKRRALADAGFPAPVFGEKTGARWDSRAIAAWLDRQAGPLLTLADPSAEAAAQADALSDELARRAAAVAAGD